MGIVAKDERKPLTPAPAGTWSSVCVDVIDLGVVEGGEYGPRHKVEFRWQIDRVNMDLEEPRRFMVLRQFTLTMNEKGSLRPFLESWLGAPYSDEEAKAGVELEDFVGMPCLLQVMHREGGEGQVWANPTAILPLPQGMVPIQPENYVRVKDRKSDRPKES